MKTINTIGCILATVLLAGCYYNVEQELYGSGTANCDTTAVTYSATITSLMNQHGCISCHSAAAPSGNVTLSTYSGVKARVADGSLIGSVTHSAGFSPMPQGAPKMTPCDIQKISTWINDGAPQN